MEETRAGEEQMCGRCGGKKQAGEEHGRETDPRNRTRLKETLWTKIRTVNVKIYAAHM